MHRGQSCRLCQLSAMPVPLSASSVYKQCITSSSLSRDYTAMLCLCTLLRWGIRVLCRSSGDICSRIVINAANTQGISSLIALHVVQKRAVADSGHTHAAFPVDLERAIGGAEDRDQCKAHHQCGYLASRGRCPATAGQLQFRARMDQGRKAPAWSAKSVMVPVVAIKVLHLAQILIPRLHESQALSSLCFGVYSLTLILSVLFCCCQQRDNFRHCHRPCLRQTAILFSHNTPGRRGACVTRTRCAMAAACIQSITANEESKARTAVGMQSVAFASSKKCRRGQYTIAASTFAVCAAKAATPFGTASRK